MTSRAPDLFSSPPGERPAGPEFRPMMSVSELLRSARDLLERRFPLMWISGELSGFSRATSGHLYFSLKDDSGQVECVMYRSRAAAIDWSPREGQHVEARALVTLYEPRGRFQLNVESLRLAGVGALYERFLRLREKLEREGLFDPSVKRPLPERPARIGVITSPAAAALHDVLSTLARRNPAAEVILYPTAVQGSGAAARIADAIAGANGRAECDVLLLVRGGGSIEDLWSFNEESVARAIRDSRIPVVVGVGHETDVTIADLAADRRAPTPTAAAELVSASREELLERITGLSSRISREMRRRIDYGGQAADSLARRLVHPAERLLSSERLLAQLAARLTQAVGRRIEGLTYRIDELPARLGARLARTLAEREARLAAMRASLTGLDPTAVLARGYSITRNARGELITASTGVAPGDRLHTTLAHGWIESDVSGQG